MTEYKAEHGIQIPKGAIGEYGKLAKALVALEVNDSIAIVRGNREDCALKQKSMGSAWAKAMKSRGFDRKMITRIYDDGGQWVLRIWRTK